MRSAWQRLAGDTVLIPIETVKITPWPSRCYVERLRLLRAWKARERLERTSSSNLVEIRADFLGRNIWEPRDATDGDGWRINHRNTNTVQSMVDALDRDIEPRSSGDNGRKVLEIAIALRESQRQCHVPVQLPLVHRSLRILPHVDRWTSRKESLGGEAYLGRYRRIAKGGARTRW